MPQPWCRRRGRNIYSLIHRECMEREVETAERPASWKILLAFGIIYFVWGSTFLAIRVGVREVPPLILAAIRFSIAGLALYAWISARGEAQPTAREWRSASLLG